MQPVTTRRFGSVVSLGTMLMLPACSSSSSSGAAPDAAVDGHHTGSDAGHGGHDAGGHTATDAGHHVGTDAGHHVGTDAGQPDTGADAGHHVGTDAGQPDTGGAGSPGFDAGPVTGTGTTYYVSTSGRDSNDGLARTTGGGHGPWRTIQNAGVTVQAGDTVIVLAGTYDGAIFGWDSPPCTDDPLCVVAGTQQQPITFEADPTAASGSVIIGAKNGQTAVGFDLEPGCNYVNIVGFVVNNSGSSDQGAGTITKEGIKVAGGQGNQILRNVVGLSGTSPSGVGGFGVLVDTVTDTTIEGNTIAYTTGTGLNGHGLYLSGSSSDLHVLGNVIYDNETIGIHINGDVSEGLPGVVTDVVISGNRIYDNGTDGQSANGINADGLQRSVISNNVIYGNSKYGIALYQIDAYGGSIDNLIVNNSIDQSMIPDSYAIEVSPCAFDNQSSVTTQPCTTTLDTSTGNVAFNNVLWNTAGVSTDSNGNAAPASDLTLSTNSTTPSASFFVDASTGNYMLAPGGPGIGTGIATFGGFSAAKAGSAGSGYDIGAFSF